MHPNHLRDPIACDIFLARIANVPCTARAYLEKDDHHHKLSQSQLHYHITTLGL